MASPRRARFPPDFIWGTATSAYQVEGGIHHNNWTAWEKQGTRLTDDTPTIRNHERCGRAAEHWVRFEEDLKLLVGLGVRMYRFSVEWSRIEPIDGQIDSAALHRYREWCLQLLEHGIQPMVTLHHFTEPCWFTAKGGWEVRENIALFVRFACAVVDVLGPYCSWWCTVNEPFGYAMCGWVAGEHPPGGKDPVVGFTVLRHMIVAHAEAYRVIHAAHAQLHSTSSADPGGLQPRGARHPRAPPCCQVSLAKNMILFQARSWWNPVLAVVVSAINWVYNLLIFDLLLTGRLRFPYNLVARVLSALGQLGPEARADMERVSHTADFVAVNHYFRWLVSVGREGGASQGQGGRDLIFHLPCGLALSACFDPAAPKSDMGWDLTPASLGVVLRWVGEYGAPVMVTENGVADAAVPDTRRQRYVETALSMVASAIEHGVDVRGYLYWSLLDNFEWAEGFEPRFGLYHVDYETMERTPTGTAEWFCEVIRTGALPHWESDETERTAPHSDSEDPSASAALQPLMSATGDRDDDSHTVSVE